MCPWLCVCPLVFVRQWMSTKPYTYFLWKACLHGQIPSSSFCLNSSKHTAHIWKTEGAVRHIWWSRQCNSFEFVGCSLVVCFSQFSSDLCVGRLETNYPNSRGQELTEKDNFGQHLQRIWHKQQSCNCPAMLCYITRTLGTCSVGGRRLP